MKTWSELESWERLAAIASEQGSGERRTRAASSRRPAGVLNGKNGYEELPPISLVRSAPPRRSSRRPTRRQVRRRRVVAIFVAIIVLLSPFEVSYVNAMTAPGTLGLGVRTVEWIRGHGGASVVAFAEKIWYGLNTPPKGGRPQAGLIPTAVPPAPPASDVGPPHLPLPAPIRPIASPSLPGEGVWHPIGKPVNGIPAAYAAFVRPDRVHTSLVAGVVWMDTALLRATQFAGGQVPGRGTTWPHMSPIPALDAANMVAVFNAGFRMSESQGGFYMGGRTAVPLRNGAASLVIYDNGTATVGAWGRDVFMSRNVASVRQNLSLIVDHGKTLPGLRHSSYTQWGATVGNQVLVWRSGLGVTADGALVYVGGPGLSVFTLARLLVRAGVVRGMQLDINTDWVNFFYFHPQPGQVASPANGKKLLSGMIRPVTRYFEPTARDFVVMSAR